MKKLFSFVLSVIMLVTMLPINAMGTEINDPYADLRESIYIQLDAQDALHLYDHFITILVPDSQTNARSTNTTWTAPNSGVLSYTYDYTYRGEDGYVNSIICYMDINDANAYLAGEYFSHGDVVMLLLGYIPGYVSGLISLMGAVSIGERALARSSIDNAGGYGKLASVYDSISGTSTSVIVGWDNYPTVSLNNSSAYNIHFEAK